jgi:hypothetical protein
MKKGLIKLILSVGLALSPLASLAEGEKIEKENNAKGIAIAMAEPMGGPLSYANVKLVKKGSTDTLTYQSNFMGMINYGLPTNSPTKYIAIISPGSDNLSYQKGDEFKPYKSEFIVNSGENPLFYFHKKD